MAQGRAEIPIDWRRVDELLEAGCLGTGVASALGIHADTLYRHCQDEKGMIWSAYAAKMKEKGDDILRKVQYDHAVKDKNTTMLIWLGKVRLNQREETTLSKADVKDALSEILGKADDTSRDLVKQTNE